MAALKYWVWFTTLTGLSDDTRLRLLHAFSSPEEIYFADAGDLALVKDIKKEELTALQEHSLDRAEKILEQCGKKEIFLVTYDDALYPQRLKNIYHPPLLLYGKGRMPLFDEEAAVAVVGTRRSTPYGRKCADIFGYELTQQGGLLVSGMAYGIDTAAMEGALRFGGFTCGVLGCGIDEVYPKGNRRLYEDVAATGVLLSEYPPGTPPYGWHFPHRNRIMSGLSLATVVVEADERSGALITANAAGEQGREVFAIPGSVLVEESAGCHRLIREGAGIATCAWDVLREYESRFPHRIRRNNAPMPPMPKNSGAPKKETVATVKEEQEEFVLPALSYEALAELDQDQQAVLLTLQEQQSRISDDIAVETDLPVHRVLSALTMLEIAGYAAAIGGRGFIRTVHIEEKQEEEEE